jgi:phage terminase large subunit GpA-like protein
MDKFFVKCLHCGEEIFIKGKVDENDFSENSIRICDDQINETIVIQCKCGNEAEF